MKVWVFLDGRQQGPFEDNELTSIPGFSENTKVWFEGLPKWYAAGSLAQLQHVFAPQDAQNTEEAQETVETIETVEITEEAPDTGMPEKPAQDTPPERPAFFRPTTRTFFRPQTPQTQAFPSEPCPPTYVGWSIFLFLCCCSPVSVAALAASICVTIFYGKGNLEKARKASEVTAWLVMISIALGMLPVMLMSALLG